MENKTVNKALLAKMNKTTLKGTTLDKAMSRDYASTGIPFLNVPLSGKLNGGLTHGWTFFAAPSKHFKTAFLMTAIAGWQKKHPAGLVVFYDSESGSDDITYFRNFGVNTDNVLHVPVFNLEDWRSDFAQKLKSIEDGDEVMFAIDSVGNTPSKKEIDDALTNSDKQDMTRAKVLKSLTRICTPYINAKKVSVVAANHVYDEQKLYGKQIMSGGTGPMLSSNTVLFITRSQEKDGKDLLGYTFTLVVEKSRSIREQSKFPITVLFDSDGIYKYTGVFDHALKLGFITSPKQGWYEYGNSGKKRRADLEMNETIMQEIVDNKDFQLLVEGLYSLDNVVKEEARSLAEKRNINMDHDAEEDSSEIDDLADLVEE